MKQWLVTGGAGFIGSHLVRKLVNSGDSVVVMDNLTSGSTDNLLNCDNTKLVAATVCDAEQCLNLAHDCDGIFHLAARVSVPDCIDNWLEGHADNAVGAINIFSAASELDIPVVYASSAAVYGNQGNHACHEKMQLMPISPYGADKLACEHQASAFYCVKSLASIGLRFFNVYGPRQDPRSPYAGVISKFASNMLNNQPHTVFGDGFQSRDFVYVDDVVNGLVKAMNILTENQPICDVADICTGKSVTLLEIIEVMSAFSDAGSKENVFLAERAGDIRYSLGSPVHMRSLLNLDVMTDVNAGLGHYLESLHS